MTGYGYRWNDGRAGGCTHIHDTMLEAIECVQHLEYCSDNDAAYDYLCGNLGYSVKGFENGLPVASLTSRESWMLMRLVETFIHDTIDWDDAPDDIELDTGKVLTEADRLILEAFGVPL